MREIEYAGMGGRVSLEILLGMWRATCLLHPILKLREAGQEKDSDSPVVTQLQGRWGKNVTPFAWASKSVLFCYSDSSITKQRHF